MKNVFINYRRQDSQAYAGRIADQLSWRLKDATVFIDVDGIPPGADFVNQIGVELSSCSVLICVIGPRWLRARSGLRRRLLIPNDFVRLEIVAALKRSVPVIPVLVEGAVMPRETSLPPSIADLAKRNALPLRDERFQDDAARLAEIIKAHLPVAAVLDDAAREGEQTRITQVLESDIAAVANAGRRRAGFATAVAFLLAAAWALGPLITGRRPSLASPKRRPRRIHNLSVSPIRMTIASGRSEFRPVKE
jgi:hypothetical protein